MLCMGRIERFQNNGVRFRTGVKRSTASSDYSSDAVPELITAGLV
jgi:hypothetical protein